MEKVTLTRKNGTTSTFVLKRCTMNDHSKLLKLEKEVQSQLNDPTILAIAEAEELERDLLHHEVWALWKEEEIAGFCVAIVHENSDFHLGSRLGWDKERQKKASIADLVIVSPPWRGYGMQRFWLNWMESLCKRAGALEMMATVSPNNPYSLANLQACGYQRMKQVRMYGGKKRYIMVKRIEG